MELVRVDDAVAAPPTLAPVKVSMTLSGEVYAALARSAAAEYCRPSDLIKSVMEGIAPALDAMNARPSVGGPTFALGDLLRNVKAIAAGGERDFLQASQRRLADLGAGIRSLEWMIKDVQDLQDRALLTRQTRPRLVE